MSKMADVMLDIEMMIEDGVHPMTIAKELNIPVTWVYVTMKELEQEVLSQNS
jgi:hypothetical protein